MFTPSSPPYSPLGRPIRVGVFEHDPDAFNCFRALPKKHCSKPGAEVELINMVMEILGWDYEIIDTKKTFGVYNDFGNIQPDGNFSGIMGLLADDQIDMGGLSMRILPERMKVAHFTFPIRYFQQVYIINKPPENDFRNFIFATFSFEIWILLLSVIVAVSFIRFFIALLIDLKPGSKSHLYTGSLLETIGIMLKQRVADPTATSTMVLEAILISSMVIFTFYYNSSMNSKLTAPPRQAIPFTHQSQLIDLLAKRKTYLTYYFDLPLEGSNVKNQERLAKVMQYNPVVTHSEEADLVAEIKRGGVFYSTYDIEFVPHPVSSWDKKNGLTVIRDTTGIISYVAFGFSISNKRICQLFNDALLKVLPGVPQITLGPGYAHKKDPEDNTIQAKKTSLSLHCHLEQLFLIYLGGMGLCVILFSAEIILYRLNQRRRRTSYRLTRTSSVDTQETYIRTEGY